MDYGGRMCRLAHRRIRDELLDDRSGLAVCRTETGPLGSTSSPNLSNFGQTGQSKGGR